LTSSYRYAIAYKPYDVLCAHRDRHKGVALEQLGVPRNLHPAGRLDRDSEGLLLLTNDGHLFHRITHPDFNHPKTYLVLVLGHPTTEALQRLRQGIAIKLGITRPANVETLISPPALTPFPKPLAAPEKTTWLRMVLYEGKNRQIKRMTAAVEHPTLRLVRVAIGPLHLPSDLKPGQWRDLTPIERHTLLTWVWPNGRPANTRAASQAPQKKRAPRRPSKGPR
jgi:23S rRNA pseudouridine2457 synthase